MLQLILTMNTDDDCSIYYKGKHYCFYDEDLAISKKFSSISEIGYFLRYHIVVTEGMKASKYTREWLDNISSSIARTPERYFRIDGNQTYVCHITEVVESEHAQIEDLTKEELGQAKLALLEVCLVLDCGMDELMDRIKGDLISEEQAGILLDI